MQEPLVGNILFLHGVYKSMFRIHLFSWRILSQAQKVFNSDIGFDEMYMGW